MSSLDFWAVRQPGSGLNGQPLARQRSSPSLQTIGHGSAPSLQVPEPLQASSPLQNNPSGHGVPLGWKPLAGQATETPSQVSVTSHAPAAALQVAPLAASAS